MTILPQYQRRDRVRISRLVGPNFEQDWSDTGVVVGAHPGQPNRYVIRWDCDGGMMSLHPSHLQPSNEAPFRGRLITYKQSQK